MAKGKKKAAAAGPSTRSGSYKVGDRIDALDLDDIWSSACVVEVSEEGKLLIRYDGWGSEWDEWVAPWAEAPGRPRRVAPLGTFTARSKAWARPTGALPWWPAVVYLRRPLPGSERGRGALALEEKTLCRFYAPPAKYYAQDQWLKVGKLSPWTVRADRRRCTLGNPKLQRAVAAADADVGPGAPPALALRYARGTLLAEDADAAADEEEGEEEEEAVGTEDAGPAKSDGEGSEAEGSDGGSGADGHAFHPAAPTLAPAPGLIKRSKKKGSTIKSSSGAQSDPSNSKAPPQVVDLEKQAMGEKTVSAVKRNEESLQVSKVTHKGKKSHTKGARAGHAGAERRPPASTDGTRRGGGGGGGPSAATAAAAAAAPEGGPAGGEHLQRRRRRGVHWDPAGAAGGEGWSARVAVGGQAIIHCNGLGSLKEAALCHDRVAFHIFGSQASLNYPNNPQYKRLIQSDPKEQIKKALESSQDVGQKNWAKQPACEDSNDENTKPVHQGLFRAFQFCTRPIREVFRLTGISPIQGHEELQAPLKRHTAWSTCSVEGPRQKSRKRESVFHIKPRPSKKRSLASQQGKQ